MKQSAIVVFAVVASFASFGLGWFTALDYQYQTQFTRCSSEKSQEYRQLCQNLVNNVFGKESL